MTPFTLVAASIGIQKPHRVSLVESNVGHRLVDFFNVAGTFVAKRQGMSGFDHHYIGVTKRGGGHFDEKLAWVRSWNGYIADNNFLLVL